MQNRRLTIIGHLPLNHQLRGLYRAVIAVAGGLLVILGVWWIVASGSPVSGAGESVLGLQANGRFGLFSLLIGVVLVIAAVLGRNIDHWLGFVLSILAMVVGLFGLAFLRTTPEPFALSPSTCVFFLVVGIVVMCASLFVGTGTADQSRHRLFEQGRMTSAEFAAAQQDGSALSH
jgi:hypothetical protein